jgi:hypothetical protein
LSPAALPPPFPHFWQRLNDLNVLGAKRRPFEANPNLCLGQSASNPRILANRDKSDLRNTGSVAVTSEFQRAAIAHGRKRSSPATRIVAPRAYEDWSIQQFQTAWGKPAIKKNVS